MSNWRVTMFQRTFPSSFDFEPWLTRQRRELLQCCLNAMHAVLENIMFCSEFNCLRPFCDFNHHTVTRNNHPFLFLSETWDAVVNGLSLSVLVMIFVSFSDKCFHTAIIFAELVRASIWLCHVIVRYNLLGFFVYFRLSNNRCISWISQYGTFLSCKSLYWYYRGWNDMAHP